MQNQGILVELTPKRCHTPPQANVGTVDFLPFQYLQPDATDFVLGYDMCYGGMISQLRMTCDLGAGQVSVLINGNVVTGLDHVPVAANARSEINADGNNQFIPGDDIILRIENGPPTILNMRGSLVLTSKSILESAILSPSPWLLLFDLPITQDLLGTNIVPVSLPQQLKRNPFMVLPAQMVPASPTDPWNGYVTYEAPEADGDLTNGWNYIFHGNVILGQVMRWGYVP
jgi:hypothetical protein